MSNIIVFRCDYFPGSGVGHLKRCSVLAHAIRLYGFIPVFVLDSNCGMLPVELSDPIEYVDGIYEEVGDAQVVIDLLQRLSSRVIVVDSYRVSDQWIQLLKKTGIIVIVLDDLGVGGDADLRIDYSPGAQRISGVARALIGPAYFITDSPCLPSRLAPPRKVIAHAGGTGNFAAAENAYIGAVRVVREKGLNLTWLCPSDMSRDWLANSGLLQSTDTVIDWLRSRHDFWADYDVVVGPASTSLYETILQGSLPVSFPISASQSSERDVWLRLGHTLHGTMEDITKSETMEALMHLAVTKYDILRGLLTIYSSGLDGFGASKVAAAISNLVNGSYSNDNLLIPSKPMIRECDIRDSHAFLIARNAPHVRALSTAPDHVISWPEHLNWWLSTNTQRFMLCDENGPKAFFWHRSQTVDSRDYLIGGWFPIASQLAFATAIQVLDWQLTFCADQYPRHIWVATINVKNSSVLMLNRRYGFTDPDARTKAVIQNLFPGTNDNFVILQRKAKLS